MLIAPLPSDEAERLKALFEYGVLDTEDEQVFDELTALASEICGTPIALISLVDSERQWFKSKYGLQAPETSRDIAFCSHAILDDEIFEIEDASLDERFHDNPLVTDDPNIRFYAGIPLKTNNGHKLGTLCVIDNTPKKLNTFQRQALVTLSHSVMAQLDLRLKIKELEKSMRLRMDFLSNISHELRTPLNAIIGFSELLIAKKQSDKTDEMDKYLELLAFSGDRLLNLINNVLDLNKLEEGAMELNPIRFALDKFATQIIDMLMPQAKAKNLHLSLEVMCEKLNKVYLDETKLGQIIINLVKNAIKFSPEGRNVDVVIHTNSVNLTIVVKDNGVGINAEDQKYLFNKFIQVEQAINKEGSGLGLSITRSLVELMQGKVNLLSKEGIGTTVKVQIPLTDCPEVGQTQYANLMKEKLHDYHDTILVVEDNEINREVAHAILSDIGVSKVEFAHDGETAVKKAQTNDYSLILMDIHMPGIDGFEAAAQIRQFKPNQYIVALTADVLTIGGLNRQNTDIDHVLYKPIEREKLIEVIEQYA